MSFLVYLYVCFRTCVCLVCVSVCACMCVSGFFCVYENMCVFMCRLVFMLLACVKIILGVSVYVTNNVFYYATLKCKSHSHERVNGERRRRFDGM